MLGEFAGGLGDTGLFIPIAVAMVTLNGLNATAVFVVTGLGVCGHRALLQGAGARCSRCKAFAAAAIALHLSAETLAAGALLMAAAMAVLATGGLADWLAQRFPVVLVRGIQAQRRPASRQGGDEPRRTGKLAGPAGDVGRPPGSRWPLPPVRLLFVSGRLSLPGSLLVLGGGAAVGLAVGGAARRCTPGLQPVSLFGPRRRRLRPRPHLAGHRPAAAHLRQRGGRDRRRRAQLFRPGRPACAALHGSPPRSASANALAGLSGALPLCHGAGGVTAHYKLGARTGASTLATGGLFIALGLGLGVLAACAAPGPRAGRPGGDARLRRDPARPPRRPAGAPRRPPDRRRRRSGHPVEPETWR